MVAGAIGALIAATFALLFAEPQIDAAIAVEASHAAHAMAGMAPDEELVSRATQKGAGLYTAMVLYGTALGGLLSIVFAGCLGRVGRLGPRGLALLLALAAFIVVVVVPAMKYPPNPPAVGLHETVRLRTGAFFAMLALSVLAAAGAGWTFRRTAGRWRAPDRVLLALGVYIGVVALFAAMLPTIDEVPGDFPASLLWRFRLAAIGTQGVFWLACADLFGRLSEPLLAPAERRR
jgi:hypothetical protein